MNVAKSLVVLYLCLFQSGLRFPFVTSEDKICKEQEILKAMWRMKPYLRIDNNTRVRELLSTTVRSQLQMMRNCTVYNGNIMITDQSAEENEFMESVRNDDLENLLNIRIIYGFVYLSLAKYRFVHNMWFLRNLREINTEDQRGLTVINSHMEKFDFSFLRLNVPKVRIQHNKDLCYLENFQTINSSIKFEVTDNMDPKTCAFFRRVCSGTCDPSKGCWGPSDRHCFECRQWRAGKKCISSCESGRIYFTPSKGRVCGHCHEKCKYGCFGPGDRRCFARPDPNDYCPMYKYFDTAVRKCKVCATPCFGNSYNERKRLILRACTGPRNMTGSRGCTVGCPVDAFLTIKTDGLFKCAMCHKDCKCGCQNASSTGCLQRDDPYAICPNDKKKLGPTYNIWIMFVVATIVFIVVLMVNTVVKRVNRKLKGKRASWSTKPIFVNKGHLENDKSLKPLKSAGRLTETQLQLGIKDQAA